MASSSDKCRHEDIEKLNGTNYQSWKYNVKLVLMSRGLFSIVDGTEKAPVIKEEDKQKPESTKTLNEWRLRSDKAYTTIALSVDKNLQVHVSSTTDAHEAWEILRKQYEVVSVSQIVRLFRRFYAAEMGEDDDLQTFITRMTSLAQQLREMKEDVSPKKFATVILGSLPPSYQNFVTSFNTQSVDDLSWDNVHGLLQEEYLKRKEIKNERSSNNLQMQTSTEEALFTTGATGASGRGFYTTGASGRGLFRGAGSLRGTGGIFRGGNLRSRGGAVFNQNTRGNNQLRGGGNSSRGGRGGGNSRPHPYSNTNRNFNGPCYNCGQNGHKAAHCPQQSENNEDDQGLFVGDAAESNPINQGNIFHVHPFLKIFIFSTENGRFSAGGANLPPPP